MPNRVILKNTSDNAVSETEINLFELATLFLKRKKFISYTVGIVVLLTTCILLLIPNKYQSTASILPSGPTDKLAGLKSLAGIGSLSLSSKNSSALFPEILHSRSTKNVVLNEEYTFMNENKPMKLTLPDYFKEDNPDKLLKKLDKITISSMDKKTGVIRIGVETKYPGFSKAIVQKYLSELENFNLNKRRSRAKDNEKYLAQQLKLKHDELETAENKLEHFQLANRNWMGSTSPEIVKELSRLQRDAKITTKAYLYLSQEYEMAKFEAQKDVPIVQLLDSPSLPTKKSSPSRLIILILTTIITFMVTLFSIVVYEIFQKRTAGPDKVEYEDFRNTLSTAFPKINRLINNSKKKETVTVQ